jgi:hypothetical protein
MSSGTPIVHDIRGARLRSQLWLSDARTVLELRILINELCPLRIITGVTISIVGDVRVRAPLKQEFDTL